MVEALLEIHAQELLGVMHELQGLLVIKLLGTCDKVFICLLRAVNSATNAVAELATEGGYLLPISI